MIISIILTIALVFGIPLLAVLFASQSGMAICIISFYLVNPIVAVAIGVFAGFNIIKRWYACFLTGIVFIITAWSLFTLNEPLFLQYAAIYIIFSFISMLTTLLIIKRKR